MIDSGIRQHDYLQVEINNYLNNRDRLNANYGKDNIVYDANYDNNDIL